jgi:hypothetical protein
MEDSGEILKRPARTAAEAKRYFSPDKIKTLTKRVIQSYVESFFTGANMSIMSSISPSSVNFNIDKSFDQKLDPTQRKLQIARYFNELRNVLPAILIMDGGVIPVSNNIGQLGSQTLRGNEWYGYYPVIRAIPITVVAAARSVEEADEMSALLSLIFNELRNISGGSYMTGNKEEGETWVIHLPNEPVEVSGISDTEVPGDPVEKIWHAEAVLASVLYEDVVAIKRQVSDLQFGGVVVNSPNMLDTLLPEIVIPDVISLNQQITILVTNMKDNYRVVLSDSKIATLNYQMLLTPRRPGPLTIKVVDYSSHHRTIVQSKTITIQ